MPYKIIFFNLFEAVFLTFINFLIAITWMNIGACIPIILSSIYSIAKIKRDISRFHGGSLKSYILFLIGKLK